MILTLKKLIQRRSNKNVKKLQGPINEEGKQFDSMALSIMPQSTNTSPSHHQQQKNVVDLNHKFNLNNYMTPTYCDYCSQLLVGLIKQGLKCECKCI